MRRDEQGQVKGAREAQQEVADVVRDLIHFRRDGLRGLRRELTDSSYRKQERIREATKVIGASGNDLLRKSSPSTWR